MTEKNHSSATAALLAGSTTLRAGRADVFRQRDRTKRKRLLRAIVIVTSLDAYLWWRYSPGRPLRLPTIPESFPWEVYLPAMLLIVAIGLMVAMPLLSGRSPHITVYPEQVEVGDGCLDRPERQEDLHRHDGVEALGEEDRPRALEVDVGGLPGEDVRRGRELRAWPLAGHGRAVYARRLKRTTTRPIPTTTTSRRLMTRTIPEVAAASTMRRRRC